METESYMLVAGFKFRADTAAGLEQFVRCFEEIVAEYPPDELAAVRDYLKEVEWRSEPIVDEREALGIAKRNGRIEFHAEKLNGGPDRHFRNSIAHELRHIWQFATNFDQSPEFRKKTTYLIWESDALDFAERFDSESNFSELNQAGLPTDDEFDRLVSAWQILTPEMRLEVAGVAIALAGEVRAAAIRGE